VFYLLNIDSGPLWARKIIDKMIDEETGAAASDPILGRLG